MYTHVFGFRLTEPRAFTSAPWANSTWATSRQSPNAALCSGASLYCGGNKESHTVTHTQRRTRARAHTHTHKGGVRK